MEALKKNNSRIFSIKTAKKMIILVVFSVVFNFCMFPLPSLANEAVESALEQEIASGLLIEPVFEEEETNIAFLPENNDVKVKKEGVHVVTAYNSDVYQTDSTPCITANGFDLCEHGIEDTIAANFLPFGAKVRIPDYFGDRIFVVRDRMNSRYSDRVDVWMLEKQDARNFGVRLAKIEILE